MKTTIIAAFFACVFAANAEARHATPGWDHSEAYGCDMNSGRCALDIARSAPSRAQSRRVGAPRPTSRARHFAQDRVSRAKAGNGSPPVLKTSPAGSLAEGSNAFLFLTERFVSPAAVCGSNIFRAFQAKVASIVETVRPGYVQIKTASGRTAIVAQSAAARFVAFIRDLESIGYPIRDLGGYVYRRIAGTRHLSKHAFGLAIDVNQVERDVVSVKMDRRLVSRLASRNGLISGGDWRHGDLGHFEIGESPRRHRHTRMASR